FVFETSNLSKDDLKTILKKQNLILQQNNFKGADVISMKSFDGKAELYITMLRNVVLLSKNQTLLKKPLWLMKMKKIMLLIVLMLHLQVNTMPFFILNPRNSIFLSNYFFKADYAQTLEAFAQLSGPMACQVSFFKNEWIYNGFASKKEGTLIDTLQFSAYGNNTLFAYLPQNTASFRSFSLGKENTYQTDNYQIKNFIQHINGYTLYTLESFDANIQQRKAVLIEADVQMLKPIFAEIDSTPVLESTYGEYEIYENNISSFLNNALLCQTFYNNKVYYAGVEGVVILSSEPNMVKQNIDAIINKTTLSTNKAFEKFNASLSANNHIYFYTDVPLMMPYLTEASLNPESINMLGKTALQINSKGNLLSCMGKIVLEKSNKEKKCFAVVKQIRYYSCI
ncbi:MAG: hypothetical protein LRY27_02800, partial [Chitinophagales bacterium]|nr:hypothetical protein [Chitinophagales bacterium]